MTSDEQPLSRGILILVAMVTAALVGALTLVVLLWPSDDATPGADGDPFDSGAPAESASGGQEESDDDAADSDGEDTDTEEETEEPTAQSLRDLSASALDEADRLRQQAEEEARRMQEEAESRFSNPLDSLRDLLGLGDDSDESDDATIDQAPRDDDGDRRGDDDGDNDSDRRGNDHGNRDGDGPGRGNGNGNGNGNEDGPGRGDGGPDEDADDDSGFSFEDLLEDARDLFTP
ncbi:Clumping factor ClfB, fibrinogen binding protein [Actinomycetales bacterium JB111]|nr:Clumping factor ClfB, fibrinogen binding protein [Actinomycetales bacterium JB111]